MISEKESCTMISREGGEAGKEITGENNIIHRNSTLFFFLGGALGLFWSSQGSEMFEET